MREACERHGTLLIFDEIPTGLGKTGAMFSSEHEGVVPDITVLGKALGGAVLPIAAVVADARLDVAGAYAIGHYTHEKNPVTARAALETIAVIEEEGLVESAAELGAHMRGRLDELAAQSPHVGDVRGRGLMMGVELVTDRDSREPAREMAERVLYRCLDSGLSFKTTVGNVLTLSPPLVIAPDELDRALDIIADAVMAG